MLLDVGNECGFNIIIFLEILCVCAPYHHCHSSIMLAVNALLQAVSKSMSAGTQTAESSNLAQGMSDVSLDASSDAPLSKRGSRNAAFFDKKTEAILKVFSNLYDPDTNPEGIVNMGIADNSLCRPELLRYFNEHRLHLSPGELTYADRTTSSARLVDALANLWNKYTPDWPEDNASPLPLTPVKPEHIAIASGATGILDELFWCICNPGDGVLLSAPYYNAFDHDLTARAETKIVQVDLPSPSTNEGNTPSFAAKTVKAYEDALLNAKKHGIECKVILVCNPHNPTGAIYPRETIVELAKLAAKYRLHFVSDEIYARSCCKTQDDDASHPAPTFVSILSIDTERECNGLHPSRVHVVTSASKDFGVNGFRLGVLISQHNKDLQRAMFGVGMLSQASAPAGALWYTWLEDKPFLEWYLRENRRRIALAYNYVTDWAKHYNIPYVPSNSGFFFMIDFRALLHIKDDDTHTYAERKDKEGDFVGKLIKHRVFVAPGSQYHHPKPGFFRFTFTQSPQALKVGLERLEKALGLEGEFEKSRPLLDLDKDGLPAPLPERPTRD